MVASNTIYCITPYVARDFEGNALLGHYIKSKYNIDVIFLTQYNWEKKIIKYKPVAVIIDHLAWNHKIDFLHKLQELKIRVYIYPTEGYYQDMGYIEHVLGNRFIANPKLDLYLLWGNDMADRLKLNDDLKDERLKMHITGHVRFDYLLNPKLHPLALKDNLRKEFNIPSNVRVVTYMSTTSYQGYPFKRFMKRYGKNANFNLDEITLIHQDNQIRWNNHIAIIQELARSLKDDVFIFWKAHPAEEYLSNYEKAFSGLSNVKLITQRDVKPFLHFSDYILQYNCTTATEAWMLGKQTIQIADAQYLDKQYLEHDKFSITVSNANELINVIKNGEKKRYKKEELNFFLTRKYGYLDGLAHKRAGDTIAADIAAVNHEQIFQAIEQYALLFNNRPAARLKRIFHIPEDIPLKPAHFLRFILSTTFGFKFKQAPEEEVTLEKVTSFEQNLEVLLGYKQI